jgi:hypothetical protein
MMIKENITLPLNTTLIGTPIEDTPLIIGQLNCISLILELSKHFRPPLFIGDTQ